MHKSAIANNAYELRAVPALISYLHACTGFIPKETWLDGIAKGYYNTWPGITVQSVRKHLKKSEITTLGHQKLIRQNICPTHKKPRSKVHDVGVVIVDTNEMDETMKNMVAMDLPGRFPITSASGHKYIFIMYFRYNLNTIMIQFLYLKKFKRVVSSVY